jgi:hypothetical protein
MKQKINRQKKGKTETDPYYYTITFKPEWWAKQPHPFTAKVKRGYVGAYDLIAKAMESGS